jgi:hypothetical protein
MVTKRNLPQRKPQDEQKHPETVQNAINPHDGVVKTAGTSGADEPKMRPASELKRMIRALHGFTMDELEHVPVVEPGSRLKPGAVYLDLGGSQRRPFMAADESYAGEDSLCVAKSAVAYPLWNRLLGAAERAPRAPKPATRSVPQGQNQPRGGRERSERRAAGPVGSTSAAPRHRGARGH